MSSDKENKGLTRKELRDLEQELGVHFEISQNENGTQRLEVFEEGGDFIVGLRSNNWYFSKEEIVGKYKAFVACRECPHSKWKDLPTL